MTAIVRTATPDDESAAAAVSDVAFAAVRAVYRPKPVAPKPATLAAQVRLIAMLGDRIVGTLRYAPIENDRLHLLGIAVHPMYQRRGIARAMVEHAAAIARDCGRRTLSLYTVKETGNVDIFTRLGFSSVREEPDDSVVSDIYPNLTDVYMECHL